MSYKVKTDAFEGPFDLLLYLVSRQKVSIGAINITEITDQYLTEVSAMKNLDLNVATDFLLVASTLLQIKAQSLIPKHEETELDPEIAQLSPNEARDALVESLVEYKQYKNAAAALEARFIETGFCFARPFGPDANFLALMPDFLRDTTLDSLGLLAANALARREVFLLESEHIAAKPIPVDVHVRAIYARIKNTKHLKFSNLVNAATPTPVVVVTFLAMLELYKQNIVTLEQVAPFGDISINYIEGSGELALASSEDGAASSAGESELENSDNGNNN